MEIILILIAAYAIYNILNHFNSLILRLKIKKSIKEKTIIQMNGVVFDFKNIISRIQLILAVTEGIFSAENLINESQNQNVIELRKVMVKHIGKLPLSSEDDTILFKAEKRMNKIISDCITFDIVKLIINILLFFMSVFVFVLQF